MTRHNSLTRVTAAQKDFAPRYRLCSAQVLGDLKYRVPNY
jgi:hypothetical protein